MSFTPLMMAGCQYDLREQILSNVRCLWPMIEDERLMSGRARTARDLPNSLRVVLMSGGHWSKAAIVYGGEVSDGVVAPSYIFAETGKFYSEQEVLYAMLVITQKRLYEMWHFHVYLATGTERHAVGTALGAIFE